MKKSTLTILSLLFLVVAVTSGKKQRRRPMRRPYAAKKCDPVKCFVGRNCQCPDIGHAMEYFDKPNMPQFILLTFDDALADTLYDNFYKPVMQDMGLVSKNTGCPIRGTFFLSHEFTNYVMVNEMANLGNEIALHTVTHGTRYTNDGKLLNGNEVMKHMTKQDWLNELQGNLKYINTFANISKDSIKGVRAPFLQTSGNPTYEAFMRMNLTYDSSLSNAKPSWPYRMTFKQKECQVPPCPDKAFHMWQIPLSNWLGLGKVACPMFDSCYFGTTRKEAYKVIKDNFARFAQHKAPFPIFLHPAMLLNNPHVRSALIQFLDEMTNEEDVHFITMSELIEFMEMGNGKVPVQKKEFAKYMTKKCAIPIQEAICEGYSTCNYNNFNDTVVMCNEKCPGELPLLENYHTLSFPEEEEASYLRTGISSKSQNDGELFSLF